MTPRQARVALVAFFVFAAGVTYNALYKQSDAVAARHVAGEARSNAPGKATGTQTGPRGGQAVKRTAVLKSDTAKAQKSPATSPDEASADTIRAIQRELNQRGYGPAGGDGIMRPGTRAAIMSYEHDNRLPLTGEATEALLTRLVLGAPADSAPAGAGEVRSPHAEALVKEVQRMLTASGYRPGPVDGRIGTETSAALRAFEQDQGLSPRGRISAEIVSRLQTAAVRLRAAEAQ